MLARNVIPKPKFAAAEKSRPVVSLVLPFEPKMEPKNMLEPRLKDALAKVEKELMALYPSAAAMPVITRLHRLIKALNYSTHKRSIALFVSPAGEETIYMDIPVNDTIVVDAPFRTRDLVGCRKKKIECLLLVLNARDSKMYRSDGLGLHLIKSNRPNTAYAYAHEAGEMEAPFPDAAGSLEFMLNKFLHQMDQGLSVVLSAYPQPVFVIGDPGITGPFSTITRNGNSIAGYIPGNSPEATEEELQSLLTPWLADWEEVLQQDALRKLEKAAENGKLSFGIDNVLNTAKYKNSRLLIVEKDFNFPALTASGSHPEGTGNPGKEEEGPSPAFYSKDLVDGIIQKVLANGGEVEWVDKGRLEEYGKIALVRLF